MRGELSRTPSDGPVVPERDEALDERARALAAESGVESAREHLEEADDRTLREQAELTGIPSPPFGEAARAARMAELMAEAGLRDVGTDAEGNVVGRRAGPDRGPPLVVAAHLDTVFPSGTPVEVREDGDRLVGPGISDDGRGLAAVLALARALDAAGIALRHPLWVVATVGEEGAGDLRGVRHLFRDDGELASRGCAGFVSLDGAGMRRIVNGGLGSLRYRIRATGPGGHSWVDWGVPNPIHVLGGIVAELTRLPLPTHPATTLSVGRWSGGTSINAIPAEAWIEVEVRSEGAEVLEAMGSRVAGVLEDARRVHRVGEDRGRLELEAELMGHRPAGSTRPDALLVRAAAAATRILGAQPQLAVSSTDANIPMMRGIPAITLGAGGEAGLAHTPGEWYRNTRGPDGIFRALLTVVLCDRMLAEDG